MSPKPLLSIAIPAYDRPDELEFGLHRFSSQIVGKYENEVEILISDDCSPGDSLSSIRRLAERHKFIRYRRYPDNIGLECNLIACAEGCTGEFLWLFGDDDYLETADGLDQIIELLRRDQHDCVVLNRTRRSFDLSKILSSNWMRLDPERSFEYSGLREFCLTHGFISIIGFISVNIFRRVPYQAIDPARYFGTMYPQLGAMVEAFHDRRTLLIGKPLLCHRTQTAEEKKAALGRKQTEADFMADARRRNAIYFSHPYVSMLNDLVVKGAFSPSDIMRIPENTVINGLLIDFLIQTITANHELALESNAQIWKRTAGFFNNLPLDAARRQRIEAVLSAHVEVGTSPSDTRFSSDSRELTISVISPSFNQGQFLGECLASVREQTYQPIEHLVFDPGSKDDSRAVASSFPHVTLVAEPDDGQSDALNKGFSRAKGDIIAWLNSDDCFAHPEVFERIAERFREADLPDIVYGRGIYINESGRKLRDVYINKDPSSLPWRFQHEDGILQPALFMKHSVVEKVGLLRKDLHYSMDYEYWIRCVKAGIKFAYIDEDLAIARYHSSNKTYGMRGDSYSEVCSVMKEHFGYVNHVWLKRYAEFLSEGHDGVLANSSTTETKDPSRLSTQYRELLIAYNSNHDTYALLLEKASQKGYGDTLREMRALGIGASVPCRTVPIDQAHELGHTLYSVGLRRWAFESKWKASEIAKAHEFLRGQIARRRSDTCVVVGNGPSLNKTDLTLLKGQDIIVSNNAFLSKDLLGYATYFTVVNYLVAEQSGHHINRMKGVHKVLPFWLAYCLNPGENTYFVDAVGRAEFSKDMFKNMSWRHTVTFFNLHLAYGLGYRKAVMIGFDHNYVQPKGIVESEVIRSYETDENHFHPDYFRGKKWQAADVNMMEEMYRLAKEAYESDGREIINSTVGGKLELFPRLPLERAIGAGSTGVRPSSQSPSSIVPGATAQGVLLGPFGRDKPTHWDETNAVASLFSGALAGATMIDVGAHSGTALLPFLKMGWRILAFEPDTSNRSKLVDQLARHDKAGLVKVDARAVSNESKAAVPFYSSEISTGISGLSAFHDSHRKTQEVDTVTLRETLVDQIAVDFLKIDTEGHDLFVLQGFPWERLKPAVIECEFEDSKTVPLGYTFHDLARFLTEKGYTVYVSEWHPIVRYGMRHDWNRLVRYPCNLSEPTTWGNLLAFRDPIDEVALVAAVKKALKTNTPSAPAAKSAAKPKTEPSRMLQTPFKPAMAAPALSGSPTKPAVPAAVPAQFGNRMLLRLEEGSVGRGWHSLEKHEWGSLRWTGPDVRATVPLAIRRDQEMLAVIAYHIAMAPDQISGLRIEADGVAVPHSIYGGTNPKCLVAWLPVARKEPGQPTELALVLPRTVVPVSVPGAGPDRRQLGLAVLSIAAMPAYPQLPVRFPPSRLMWLLRRVGLVGYPPVGEFPLTHFDGLAYLEAHPDVADAVMAGMPSALEHYRRHGFKDGRQLALAVARPPNPGRLVDIFDGIAYLEAYPDVAEAVRSEAVPSALDHFIRFGRHDGRLVRRRFDGAAQRGSGVDLARLDAARLMRIEIAALKAQLASDIAGRADQLGNRLEAASAESRKTLQALDNQISAVARTGDEKARDLLSQLRVLRADALETERQLAARRAELATLQQHTERRAETRAQELLSQLSALRAEAMETEKHLSAGKNDLAYLRQEIEQQLGTLSGGLDQVSAGVATVVAGHEAFEREMAEQLAIVRSTVTEAQEGIAAAVVGQNALQKELAAAARQEIERMRSEFATALAQREAQERAMLQKIDQLRSNLQEAQNRLAASARAEEVDRLRREATGDLERMRGEFTRTLAQREAQEQAMLRKIDLLGASLQEAQNRLAGSARADDLEHLRRETTGDMSNFRREATGELERVRRDATGDLERVRRDTTEDVDRVRRELISNGGIWRAREQAVLGQIEALKAEVVAAKTRAELAEVKVASAQRELGAETWQIAGSLQQLANRLDSASTDVTKLQQEVGTVKGQAARLVHPSLSALNVLGYQAHPRMLQKADAERLAKHWAPLLGLKVEEKELYYLAHRVCSIENACTGRLAASVNDMLLRILVARAVKADSLKILEIGTLFGLGVGALHEALAPLFERVQFTVIDPLEGYYGAANKDILTGVPVNRSVFEENLRRSGVSANDVKLIQRLSTDPQALKQASRNQYDLLIIDADHSYQGVKNDTEKFVATARPGAFVIYDDYGNPHWPDVKKYVDAEVLPRKDLRFVGAEWHTAVCQVTGASA